MAESQERIDEPASVEQRGPADRSRGTAILVVVILGVAAGLRLGGLGTKDLWIDEANGVFMAKQALPELIARLELDSSPPLYYLLLRGWMGVFGDSEFSVRALSALGGVAMVGVVYVVGRRLFSQEAAVMAAGLVALSPIQVYYSQQARMYSLLPVFAMLSAYWLWRAVENGGRRFVVGWAVATLAVIYTHNVGLYVPAVEAAALAISGELRKRPGTWLVGAGVVAAGYLPWMAVLRYQLENEAHYSWFIPFWQRDGAVVSVLRTLGSFAPGGPQPAYVDLTGSGSWGYVSAVVFTLAAGLGLMCMVRRKAAKDAEVFRVRGLAAFVFGPLGLGLVTSTVMQPNYVAGRTDQLVFPGFVLLAAVGLMAIRARAVRYVVLAALAGFSIAGLRGVYTGASPNGDRAIARVVADRARPGEAVLCTSLTRASLEYYLGRWKVPVTLFSFPRETAGHMGNQDDRALLMRPDRPAEEARLVRDEVRAASGKEGRFFVVLALTPVNKPLYEALITSDGSGKVEPVGQFVQSGTGVPVVVLSCGDG